MMSDIGNDLAAAVYHAQQSGAFEEMYEAGVPTSNTAYLRVYILLKNKGLSPKEIAEIVNWMKVATLMDVTTPM